MNDSLYNSPQSSISTFLLNSFYSDSLNCSIIIPTRNAAHCNVKDTTIKYHDHCSWVYALTPQLDFLFDPIKVRYGLGHVSHLIPVRIKNRDFILAVSRCDVTSVQLQLYNLDGKIVKQKYLRNINKFIPYPQSNSDKYSCILSTDKSLTLLDEDLNISREIDINGNSNTSEPLFIDDFDFDGKEEIIYMTNVSKTITIIDDDYNEIITFPSHKIENIKVVEPIESDKSNEIIVFIKGNYFGYFIRIYRNPYHLLSYAFPLLIVLGFLFLINIVVKQRIATINKENQKEKNLIESQLKIANNKMSPHFQLNVINSISYLYENNKDKAQYYMGKYSRLVTQVMMDVDKIDTTIKNELQFTQNYLILEQLRLDNKFDFSIEIDENLDQELLIPRMAIFTFCENAVKHGLFHLIGKGELKVIGKKMSNTEILFTIEDNGIGRDESRKNSANRAGIGLKTLNSIFKYFKQYKNTVLTYRLIDNNKGEGLKVELRIVYSRIS